MFKLFFILIFSSQLVFAQTLDSAYLPTDGAYRELVNQISVLTDKDGTKTIADIVKMENDFSPLDRPFSAGFTQETHWFRIVLQRPEEAPKNWVLSVEPATINNLRFFSKNDAGHFVMQQAGNFFAASLRHDDKEFGSFSFPLTLPDTSPSVIYLRQQTKTLSKLEVSIATPSKMAENNNLKKLLLSFLFGMLLIVSINTLLMWQQTSYLPYLAFLGYIFGAVVNLTSVEGVLALYLLPNLPMLNATIAPLAFGIFVLSKAVFFIYFYDTKSHFPKLHIVFQLFILLLLMVMLSIPFDWFTSVAPIALLLMVVMSLLQLYVSKVSIKKQHIAGGKFIFYGILIYFSVFIVTLLTALGYLSTNFTMILSFQLSTFVLLSFIGLLQRYQSIMQSHQQDKDRVTHAEDLVAIERQQNKDKSTFLNLVAHELKTPLAVIDGAIQTLETQTYEDNELVHNRHGKIRKSVSYLNTILDNTLTAERYENNPLHPQIAPVLLKPFIEQIITTYPTTNHYNSEIIDGFCCWADQELLSLILSNLLVNAVKYSPENSDITLICQKVTHNNQPGSLLAISNLYLGNDDPDTSQWFNKYYQSDRQLAKGGNNGLGLGLYLVNKLVKAHDGNITCSITPHDKLRIVTVNLWLPDSVEATKT